MEFSFKLLLPFLTFVSVALMASQAAGDVSPDAYWKSVLPNAPMPKAVKDILHNEWTEDKSTSVGVGKGGVNVNTGKGTPSSGTNVNVGGKGGKGGVTVNTGPKGKPVYVGVTPGASPFLYQYAATETQIHDNRNVAVFFLEKDLKRGTKMNLYFTKTTNAETTFLPRQAADKIPFSSEKMPEILDQFSVKPDSKEAEVMKNTIKECEEPGIKGEEKYCATSLESMVDFTTSKLGKSVQPISTEVEKETDRTRLEYPDVTRLEYPDMTRLEEYRVFGVKKMGGEKSVVCHKQNYAYAVFYCHKTTTTKAYVVSLVGVDGTKAKAVAVCHTDTSAWNPKHLAFQVLKVKPGTVPVCHFLPEDHVVWVQN